MIPIEGGEGGGEGNRATCHTHGRGGHYRAEEAISLNSKATSVARHQGKLYYRERVSEKGLALT